MENVTIFYMTNNETSSEITHSTDNVVNVSFTSSGQIVNQTTYSSRTTFEPTEETVNQTSYISRTTFEPTEETVNQTSYISRTTFKSVEEIVNQTSSMSGIASASTANYETSTDADFHNYDDFYSYYGDEYMYPGYSFERPFYLYIWEVLVIFTSLVNIMVIIVLLRKKMRNPTNIVLATIAVSDSLTGLVTLPTYIMVFLRHDPVTENQPNYYSYNYPSYNDSLFDGAHETNATIPDNGLTAEAVDGYKLTKDLCRGFMISKYFLSKCFHTISIFLTLFLGIHRYIAIAYPYKSQFLLNLPRTLICCGIIFAVSPILHIYHLVGDRASGGMCQWELKEPKCGKGCIYLWFAFFIRHFIPCVVLVVFTFLFIMQLRVGERTLRRMDSNKSQLSRRADENRRISLVVTAIVIVFLIPEIPYGIFLLYNAFDKSVNQGKGIDLETNRAIQLVYELFLVLSFHANFYIYTIFNRRFRKTLYRTFFKPIRRLIGDPERLSISRSSTTSHRPSNRRTDTGSVKNKFEMETMVTSGSNESTVKATTHVESNLIDKDLTTQNADVVTAL